jgi:Ssp1 endopeptidase immunity protein Rap1a
VNGEGQVEREIVMLKRILPAAVLTISLIAPIQAVAYTISYAKYFNELCKGNPAQQSLVMYYVQGLLDGYALSSVHVAAFFMLQKQEPDLDRAIKRAEKVLGMACIPDEVDLSVILKAFCAHLAAHPLEETAPLKSQTANSQFEEAMAKTWPCPPN